MEETSNFYFLYDTKQEPIPQEKEWGLRYEKFVKHVPPPPEEDGNVKLYEENEMIKVNQEESERVKRLEDAGQSQFEENTLNNEGNKKEEL